MNILTSCLVNAALEFFNGQKTKAILRKPSQRQHRNDDDHDDDHHHDADSDADADNDGSSSVDDDASDHLNDETTFKFQSDFFRLNYLRTFWL